MILIITKKNVKIIALKDEAVSWWKFEPGPQLAPRPTRPDSNVSISRSLYFGIVLTASFFVHVSAIKAIHTEVILCHDSRGWKQ